MRVASTRKNTCASEPSSSSTTTSDLDRRQLGRRERSVLERLGPDAEDHAIGAGLTRPPCSDRAERGTARIATSPAVEVGLDEIHRRRADEPGDEEVARLLVENLRRVDLEDVAVSHHGDPLAERHRLDLVVRDVDRRDAERWCSCASDARMPTRSFASRFDSGSSMRNACGSRTIARPIATRWR